MRVCLDALPLSSPRGGIRRYTEELLQAFCRLTDDVEFVLLGDPSATSGFELDERFSWIFRRSVSIPHLLDQFQLFGAKRHLDLFHGTNYWAPLRQPCPTVVTVHDLTVQLLPNTHPRIRRLRHRMLPRICRNAHCVISDSKATRKDLLELYQLPKENVSVVELAVSQKFRSDPDPQTLSRVSEYHRLPSRFVLFFGSLNPRKNLSVLVRAMAQLKRDGNRVPLVIGGEGDRSYVNSIREIAKSSGLEIGRDVLFLGGVSEEDLPALYRLCAAFVFPSRYEGFGLPPIEAMACGAQVLVSNNSSLHEIYRESANLVDTSDPLQLARGIAEVLSRDKRSEEALESGRAKVLERSWDDVARETLAVYGRAVKEGPKTS